MSKLRLIASVLLMVSLCSLISACGGAPAATTPAAPATTTPAAPAAPAPAAPAPATPSAPATPAPAAPATPAANAKLEEFKAKKYKAAYVFLGTMTDIFKMAFDGATSTGAAVGMTVDIFTCSDDDMKFQDTITTCANQGYNAMFLSHGKKEYSHDLVKMLVDKGIKVVTFDTQLVDSAGNPAPIAGVTQMFQNDQLMADQLLDYICTVMYPEKVAKKEKVNVLKLWRGPGISPFDRRQETYLKYEQAGKINTLEVLGPIDLSNSEASMTAVVGAAITKYSKGSVDVIWSAYDAYARGAFIALKDANRTDIPLVTVDISNQDIQFMLDGINGEKIWKACSAVHFATVGEQAIRLCIQKLAGDPTPDVYNLTPSLVTYDKLKPGVNVINLGELVPGYGVNNDNVSDWAKEALLK